MGTPQNLPLRFSFLGAQPNFAATGLLVTSGKLTSSSFEVYFPFHVR